MKISIITPESLAALQLGYRRPLEGSELAEGRKRVTGLGDPNGPGIHGKFNDFRFANLTNVMGGAIHQNAFEFTSSQFHPLGTLGISKDGTFFRYCQAGAVDLVAGTLQQRAAPVANHLANTPPAVAIGATSFTYTPGATAGAANLYAEGYLQVDTTPGNGYRYRISGHPAISSSTAFSLYLDPDDPIQVALTTSSRVGLHHNRWKNVIQCPTAVTARVAGVAVSVIPATYYGWLVTKGPWPCLINGTPAITSPVANSATTAGALDVWTTAAAAVTITPVGHMMQVGVSGRNNLVDLTID